MNSENLKTASLYINNQLLCRGLLRHGRGIDFALLESSDDTTDTAASIMRVVNNLILLRDRDAAQREKAADTIRTLRTDIMKLSTELDQVKGVNSEINRRLAVAEAERKTTEGRLRVSESKERALRVKAEKMKSTVGQVRAMCAVDCRRREKVIDGLKKAALESGYTRGAKNSKTREIIIVGDIGEEQSATRPISLDSKDCNLRSETNEFLTELVRGLSEENENLNRLAQWTLDMMKEMSAWDSSHNNNSSNIQIEPMDISSEMEAVIEHIRILLTSPSFVSLEELEVREEEILRLREGWEHMEKRWRELVSMIDGWRKRMLRGGETVNIEELKMGLRLGPKFPKCDGSSALKLSVVPEYSSEDEDICHDLVGTQEKPEKLECNSQTEFEEVDDSDDDDDDDDNNVDDDDNDTDEDYDNDDNDNTDEIMSNGIDLCQKNSSHDYVKREKEVKEYIHEVHEEMPIVASSMNSSPTAQISPLPEANLVITPANPSPLRQERTCSPISEEDTIDLLQLNSSPLSKTEAEQDSKSANLHQKTQTPPDKAIEAHSKTFSHPQMTGSKLIQSRACPNTLSRESTLLQSSKSTHQNLAVVSGSQSPQPRQQNRASNPHSQVCQVDSPSHRKSNSPSKSQILNENVSVPSPHPVKPASTPKLKLGSDCRLPRPRSTASQQSPLTIANIAAKLAASEREANAARVRAKLRAARSEKNINTSVDRNQSLNSGQQKPLLRQTPVKIKAKSPSKTFDDRNRANADEYQREMNITDEHGKSEDVSSIDSVKKIKNCSNRKRKAKDLAHKETGKSRRRRSTLNPWELERVIRGEVVLDE